MTLSRLPNELLEQIIAHTLPEGFESVALTCRRTHALSTSFIQNHNTLRSRFSDFNYYNYEDTSEVINTVRTAFDVITRIAIEPVAARYIRHADFAEDSRFTRGRPRSLLADVNCGGAVLKLFAGSPYLKHAGLDWQEFYAKIEEDLEAVRYSQHAAAFLMSLLPNVETLTLPRRWKPLDETNKLVDVVVRKASQPHFSDDKPSLTQVTKVESHVAFVPQERFDLDWVNPFLALPHVRSFNGPGCVAMGDDGHKSVVSIDPQGRFGETLIAIKLKACCIDEVGIADFLQDATHLRTLRYSHMTKAHSGPQEWNICKFINAIGRKVGSHLEELSVFICKLRGSIAPGTISMRDFQRLRKLELPLEVVTCNLDAAKSYQPATRPKSSLVIGDRSVDECHEENNDEPLIGDLVPTTVSHLSLISSGTDDHAKALEVQFRHFAVRKDSRLSALEEIQLSCPYDAGDAYKQQYTNVLTETKKTNVVLHRN